MEEFNISARANGEEAADAEPEPHPLDNGVVTSILADIKELWDGHADAVRTRDREALHKAKLLLYERYEELEELRDYLEQTKAIAEIDPDILDVALAELDFSSKSLQNVLK